MARRGPRGRLRSTLDSVFLHDMKNLEFRLSLLLSNLEEHYGDPDFKRSVVELLQSSLEKVDSVVDRWSAYRDALLVKVPLDVNDLLRSVAARARSRDGAGPRPGHLEIRESALLPVWGDSNYLGDAFLSIVQNALEAAGSGGRVEIATAMEEKRGAPRAVVTISDDGPGMSREFQRTRLFHPFQTTKPNGVGLGLYTARNIIRFHGGTLTVRSRPGEGTSVIVSLRAEPETGSS
ncbi:MAG TPA: ATP-binding protein [Thermoanaerobaculia bacterium]|jgi:signal transduction histidine kinase|nr:ATP-binding protein [Thermoanaerobaculia bacterium]